MEFVVKMKTYNMKTNIVILYLFFTIILYPVARKMILMIK